MFMKMFGGIATLICLFFIIIFIGITFIFGIDTCSKDLMESVKSPNGDYTIKTYLRIELIGFYIDEEGKIYIREGNEQLSRIIEFESNDEIGNYIEYLINLSILKKLDNEQIEVRRAETGRKVNIVMKKRQLEMNTMAREKYGASWKEQIKYLI